MAEVSARCLVYVPVCIVQQSGVCCNHCIAHTSACVCLHATGERRQLINTAIAACGNTGEIQGCFFTPVWPLPLCWCRTGMFAELGDRVRIGLGWVRSGTTLSWAASQNFSWKLLFCQKWNLPMTSLPLVIVYSHWKKMYVLNSGRIT